jgi:hypothetical protein
MVENSNKMMTDSKDYIHEPYSMVQSNRIQTEGMSELNMDPTKNNLAKYEQNRLHHIRM